jgi:hypothetical protein
MHGCLALLNFTAAKLAACFCVLQRFNNKAIAISVTMNPDDQLRQIREERARRYHEERQQQQAAEAAAGGPATPPPPPPPPQGPPRLDEQRDRDPLLTDVPLVTTQPAPAGGRLIGLPGQNAHLTQAELDQRARAAQKNRDLDAHNRAYDAHHQPQPAPLGGGEAVAVRPPDGNRVMRMADVEPFEMDLGPMPDLTDMLGGTAEALRAMGVDTDAEFEGMDESIEREIDAQLAADATAPDAAGNMLQIYDGHGRDMVGQVDEAETEAFDPQGGGGADAPASGKGLDEYSVVSTLQDVSKLPDGGRCCAVCQEEFRVGDRVRRLNCLHAFHADCVDQWLRRHARCPVCKHEFDAGQQLMDAVTAKEQP